MIGARRAVTVKQVLFNQFVLYTLLCLTTYSKCATVKALANSPERLQSLLTMLDLPVDKLNSVELEKLKEVLVKFTDVFALDDSELARLY